jgi:iron complex outermembrane recepter protein
MQGPRSARDAELDLQALVTPNLKLRASYGYTHATFRENSPRPDTDLGGNFIPYVPRYTLFCGLNYRIPLRSGAIRALRLGLNYQGIGEHFWNDANTFSQKAYTLLNGMVSVETDHLGLDVFVNNITSTEYHSFSFAALGNHYVQPGRPTTFGMNLRYSF